MQFLADTASAEQGDSCIVYISTHTSIAMYGYLKWNATCVTATFAGEKVLAHLLNDGEILKLVWNSLCDEESYVRATAVSTIESLINCPLSAKLLWLQHSQVRTIVECVQMLLFLAS